MARKPVLLDTPFRLDNGLTHAENELRKNEFKYSAQHWEAALKEGKFVVIHDFKLHMGGPLSVCRNCGVIRLNTNPRYAFCTATDLHYSEEHDG